MKAVLECINKMGSGSFLVRRFEEKCFSAPYHFHPEYELTYIVKGAGKRYVGTHMSDYGPGDLVLLGANLPHCWKTEVREDNEASVSIVVHFNVDHSTAGLFSLPEFSAIVRMLQHSEHGLQFTAANRDIKEKITALPAHPDPFERLMLLLHILQHLASLPEYTIIDKQALFPNLSALHKERMNAVIAYIVENFQYKVSLAEAAAIANMTPHAFCKYFKKLTRKTFFEVITDYRIDYACRQLIHTSKPAGQIGYESGFNDGAHFYKTFRACTKLSPVHYRNAFMKKLA